MTFVEYVKCTAVTALAYALCLGLVVCLQSLDAGRLPV